MPRFFCAVEIKFEMRDVILGGRGKMGTMIPGGSDRGRRADVVWCRLIFVQCTRLYSYYSNNKVPMHTHTDPQCTQHWMHGQQTNRLDRYITVEREKKNRLSRPASSSLGTEWKKQEKRNNADKKKRADWANRWEPGKMHSIIHTHTVCVQKQRIGNYW